MDGDTHDVLTLYQTICEQADGKGDDGIDDTAAALLVLAVVVSRQRSQFAADLLSDAIGRGIEQGGLSGPVQDIAQAIREHG